MLEIITRNMANKVIRENLDDLIRFAFFRLGDMPEAEDVVHEAVLRILDNPPSLLKSGKLKAYLYRTVYNLCQDSFREGRHHTKIPIVSIEEKEEESEETLDMEEAERLYGLLGNIPEKESEVIRMHVIDELSFAEISRIMHIPQSTVKYRYKCGMSKMRDLYSDEVV
ncbi:MAG: RNA polymerase sigma factor [Muribaculaceae bacterium]|nr:RNA polymerase sigma factor [Muribaculaceae bacterium]